MKSSIEQRYAIKFCFQAGKNATETFSMLQEVYKDSCLSYSQVKKWHKAFKEGRLEVADELRSGRPSTSRNDENVQQVRDFLNRDARLSVYKVADALRMSKSTVHRIVTEKVAMRKVFDKVVPQALTDDQKKLRDETPIEDNIDEEDGSPSVLNPTVGVLISRQNELLEKACSYLEKSSKTDKAANNHIAQAWSEKLLLLEPQQRAFAEKAINDVLFEASQGTLSRHSVKINED